ncbi:hypothetical protein L7F22_063496 [Adiantum nelumboides]|nr:hypothetical protein [Adiantum nelumboides]
MELRNAPCYHAAIMRLLPSSMRRALTLHHFTPATPPAHGHPHTHTDTHNLHGRECLCDRDRRQYRKDWRSDYSNKSCLPPASASAPAPAPASPMSPQEINALSRLNSPPLLNTHHPFRSGTVYLEVKLAELLSQRKHGLKSTCTVPDAHCFRVCWQLLGELSRMKTPFAQAFSTIYKELDTSIHSSYVAAKQDSITSAFHFVPYFELFSKLGGQKVEIEAERDNMITEVLVFEAEISKVEQDIEVCNQKLNAAEGFGREMEMKLSTILDALERILEQVQAIALRIKNDALFQVRTLQGGLLQLKKKVQNARVEQAKAHEVQYEQLVRKEHYAKLQENYKSMLQELHEAQAELDVAQNQAFDRWITLDYS